MRRDPGDWTVVTLTVAALIIIVVAIVLRAEAHTAPDPEICERITACEEEWVEGWNSHKLTWEANLPQPRRSERVPRAVGVGVEQWRPLVAAYFPAGEVDRALCIMAHESRGNPNAKNPRSSAAGLFQFLRSTWNSVPLSVSGGSYESGQVYQPEPNVRSAAWLQARSGWTQWSPYNGGECR